MQHLSEGTLLQGGKFKIEKMLGQGGFGITYLASQTISVEGSIGEIKTEIKLAIKEFFMKDVCNRDENSTIVSVPSVGSKELVERFKQKFIKEARSISKLKHPHIVKVVDIFEENGTAYYVMEYHNGGSLGDLVKDGNPLPEFDAVRYITQIADAVGYIHKRNINHLDIKPSNILLDGKSNGILIDFGLSKQYDEQGSQTSSTPVGISHGYAPMEQYKQNGVSTFSPQSDIYSLGATLYKLVTGATPPQAMDIFNDGLPELPAHLSDGVKRAIEQAMQLHKSNRPATAEEFIALLGASGAENEETMVNASHEETVIDVQPKVTVVSEPAKKTPEQSAELKKPEPKKPEPQKSNLWKWVAAAVVLLLLAVGGINWWGDYKAEQAAEAEQQRLAAIEQARQDSIAKARAEQQRLAAIEQARQDSIAKARAAKKAEQQRLAAIEQARKDSIAKVRAAEKAEQQRLAAIEQARKDSIANVRAAEKEQAKNQKKYDYKDTYSEGLARVKLNGKWGYIDKSGNEVIPLKYDGARGVFEGLARVKLNGKWGFIDKSGNEVVPCKYDDAGVGFNEGLARVELNGKWGYIDKSGNVVIPCKYDLTNNFKEGRAIVYLNGERFYIDKKGNRLN